METHIRWKFESVQGIEKAINNLYDRTTSNRNDIDLLIAQVHLLCLPWWRFKERRFTKNWIKNLAKENEEDGLDSIS